MTGGVPVFPYPSTITGPAGTSFSPSSAAKSRPSAPIDLRLGNKVDLGPTSGLGERYDLLPDPSDDRPTLMDTFSSTKAVGPLIHPCPSPPPNPNPTPNSAPVPPCLFSLILARFPSATNLAFCLSISNRAASNASILADARLPSFRATMFWTLTCRASLSTSSSSSALRSYSQSISVSVLICWGEMLGKVDDAGTWVLLLLR